MITYAIAGLFEKCDMISNAPRKYAMHSPKEWWVNLRMLLKATIMGDMIILNPKV